MDFKEKYRGLVKKVKDLYIANGVRLTNEDFASRLDRSTVYFGTLVGKSGAVTQEHIDEFEAAFKDELENGIIRGAKQNPERAILFALLEDYAHYKADGTGRSYDEVKAELIRKGDEILSGLDSWLPGQK